MAVEAGSRLGRLLIGEPLGEGTLGTAHRASHPDHGPVVVKLLRGAREARERFLALAPGLARAAHPHLARVLEHGVHEGTPYLVVEAAGRVPLDLRFPAPSPAAVLPVLAAVASALDHLHGLGLVHGRLACHQVLVDEEDRPRVTDFGLWPLRATVDEGDDAVAYAAPEVLAGAAPTAASDRYAFAVLAYRLLTGGLPSEGDAHRSTAEPDGAPAAPDLGLGEGVGVALARGLEPEPQARWESCATMVDALRSALLQDAPPLVITPPGEKVAETGAGWRRALILGGGTAGVAAAIALGWTVWNGPGTVAVSLSSSTVSPGDPVVVDAVNLPPGQTGVVVLHSRPATLGSFRASGQGEVRVRVTIPSWTPPGRHDLALCWRSACHGDAPLIVLPPPAPASPSSPTPGSPRTAPPSAPGPLAAPAPAPQPAPPAVRPRTTGRGPVSASPPAPPTTSTPRPTPPPTPPPT
ncbi:MAG TPA: serine/threonine-protein kinase, partial [Candidatus Dormibacteraeota bacterium]|nr:serine/threonine-protein kinase [Candidatus Dormibacteraeota bacterium]